MVLQKYGGNYDLETCFCSGNDLTLRYLTWLCSTIIVAFSRRGPCTSSDDTSHKYGRLFHILKSRLGGIQGRCTVALTEMGSDCEGYHPINSLGNQSRIYDRLLKTCSIYILHLHVEITRVLLLTIIFRLTSVYSICFSNPISSVPSLASNCRTRCDCVDVQLDPVCSNDGWTKYFSACHAGCTQLSLQNDSIVSDILESSVGK